MDLARFRQRIDQADPELLQLLELLRSLDPAPQHMVVRTALTCDTVNPWGDQHAQLDPSWDSRIIKDIDGARACAAEGVDTAAVREEIAAMAKRSGKLDSGEEVRWLVES